MGEPLAAGSMTLESLKFLLGDEHTTQEHLDAEPLTAEEMEAVEQLMPPWTISSELGDKGFGKVFARSIMSMNDDHRDRLYEFDEDIDVGLIEVLGGYGVVTGGHSTTNSSLDGSVTSLELNVYLRGGPISLGDVRRALQAEAYLQQNGYVSASEEAS